jgi:hypothetical protein
MVGNADLPGVIQPLWPNLPVQISQEKTKRSGDVSEWFIEQLIEDVIPNTCAHSQRLELVVEKRIRRYCAVHVLYAHSRLSSTPSMFRHQFLGFDFNGGYSSVGNPWGMPWIARLIHREP